MTGRGVTLDWRRKYIVLKARLIWLAPPINKSDPSEASPVFEQQQQVIILPKEITKPFQIRKGFVDYMQLFFRINSP
jgi:hypothetical protein